MVSGGDEAEGDADPVAPPRKDAVCYIKSFTGFYTMQRTGHMISLQNIPG